MNEPEEIDLATYKRLSAKLPRKKGKKPRADIPRAASDPRDGLTTLLRAGWSTRTRDGGKEHQLYRGALSTQWHADQSDACAEAKEIEKGSS